MSGEHSLRPVTSSGGNVGQQCYHPNVTAHSLSVCSDTRSGHHVLFIKTRRLNIDVEAKEDTQKEIIVRMFLIFVDKSLFIMLIRYLQSREIIEIEH